MAIVPISRSVATTSAAHVTPRPRVRPTNPTPVASFDASASAAGDPPGAAGNDIYRVGYKRPPKHTQFRKGESGNRRGRPKNARGLKTIVRELLGQKVTVRTSAGQERMTKMEAMFHKIMEQAFAGNLRALQSLLALYQSAVPEEPTDLAGGGAHAALSIADLNDHDRAMLAELRASILQEQKGVS